MTEKTLKQDEIDALFEAARSAAPGDGADRGAGPGRALQLLLRGTDFDRAVARHQHAERPVRPQPDAQSGRMAAHPVSGQPGLGRADSVQRVSAAHSRDQLRGLGAPGAAGGALGAATGSGLAPPIIDLLLGGDGKDGPLRELTDIEESILASVVEIICRELTAAWQPVGLSFSFERRQMQTQVARIMSVTEKTLCLSFEIRMPHSSGLLNLAFPAVVANTILRRLTTDWGRRRRHAGETRARMADAGAAHPLRLLAAAARGAAGGQRARESGAGRRVLRLNLGAERALRVAGGRPAALRWPRPCARDRTAPRASSARSAGESDEDLSRLLGRGGHGALFAGAGRRAGAGRVASQAARGGIVRLCRHACRGRGGPVRRRRSTARFWRRR